MIKAFKNRNDAIEFAKRYTLKPSTDFNNYSGTYGTQYDAHIVDPRIVKQYPVEYPKLTVEYADRMVELFNELKLCTYYNKIGVSDVEM